MTTLKIKQTALLATAATAAFVLISTIFAQQPRAVDAKILSTAGTAKDALPGTWLTYGLTQNEQRYSLLKHSSIPLDIHYLKLDELGLKRAYDPLASTEFTYSRFLVPYLCNYRGKALFLDNDMLCLGDIKEVAELDMRSSALRVISISLAAVDRAAICLMACRASRISCLVKKINASRPVFGRSAKCLRSSDASGSTLSIEIPFLSLVI